TPVLGRNRPRARPRPKNHKESYTSIPVHLEIQGNRRSGSSKSVRKAGWLRERYRSAWRQSHFGGERSKGSPSMEVHASKFRDQGGSLCSLRPALRKLTQSRTNQLCQIRVWNQSQNKPGHPSTLGRMPGKMTRSSWLVRPSD